jgi:hypothetical protein
MTITPVSAPRLAAASAPEAALDPEIGDELR